MANIFSRDNYDWKELLWSNIIYLCRNEGDVYYARVIVSPTLNNLRARTENNNVPVDVEQIEENIVSNFLRQWNQMGGIDNQQLANGIMSIVDALYEIRNRYGNESILNRTIEELEENHREQISEIYQIKNRIRGVGDTALSKILHILFPALFPMWDKDIKEEFEEAYREKYNCRRVPREDILYYEFMKKIKEMIEKFKQSYRKEKRKNNLLKYLNKFTFHLFKPLIENEENENDENERIEPESINSRTLIKYVDQYLWLYITHHLNNFPTLNIKDVSEKTSKYILTLCLEK